MTDQVETGAREGLDLGRSFVVEGAAGTGKSELAFQRYVTALCNTKRPEEALFLVDGGSVVRRYRQRIARILQGEGDEDNRQLAAHDQQLAWGLLEQPDRLQIHTLGSLAMELVAAAPVSSGCGAEARITGDPDAYYRTAARALLRTLDHDERVAPNLETLLLHLDNDLVRAELLLAGLLRRRAGLQRCLHLDNPEANRAGLQSALEDAVVMTLSDLSAAIPVDVAEEIVVLATQAGKRLSMRGSESPITLWRDLRSLPPADTANLAAWAGLGELLLEADCSIRREYGEEQGFESPDSADERRERELRGELHARIEILAARLAEISGFDSRLAAIRKVSDVRYTHLQWTVLQSLLAVLPRVINDLARAFRALGEMDLTEVVQGAARALESSQAEIFGSQGLQHIIVDNAHDISFAGLSLIEKLTRTWTGDDNRSLFITGNPFASICRSEGAQPALFLKILNSGLGHCELSMLSLTKQRRSGSAIVDWINQRFCHESDAVIGEGGMPFLPAEPHNDESGDVQVHGVTGESEAENQAIVQLLKEQPQLRDHSVAILLADGTAGASIVDGLRNAGIRCHSEGVDLMGQRSVITDLHALTRALCHLADRVAWLTVLRAPWCGLTLEDLHRLVADSSQAAIWDLVIDEQRRSRLSEDGQQRLSRIKRVMAQTLAERGRRDLRRLVEGVWTALGGAVCLRNEFELEQSRDFFRLLERIDDGGEPDSLEALDAAVAGLFAHGPSESEIRDGSVLVTTIRHARRRTFDTVILAGLSTSISLPEDDDALRWLVRPDQFGSAQLLLAPVSGEGGGEEINHWVESLQTSMHDNELRRLFYVGAARADTHLHVVVRLPFDDVCWGRPPKHSPMGAMYDELHELLPDQPSHASNPDTGTGVPIRRLPSNWLLPEAPQPKVWARRETQARMGDDRLAGLTDEARIIAPVLWRTLSDIAVQGPVDWTMRTLDGLENSLQQLFAMMGLSQDEVASAADRAGLAIRNMLDDDRSKWMFDPANENIKSPLRLTGWLDDSLIDADIDLSFVDTDGTQWIVFFCFPELDGADNNEAIDLFVATHRSVWNNSAQLIRRYTPKPVRTG
ncbi:MAG: hypothetical protein OEQ74_04595, partial [Gammaproteobacteria bacterium]|nr:hypothetical protein [Gammaproteobacteria bacterium]